MDYKDEVSLALAELTKEETTKEDANKTVETKEENKEIVDALHKNREKYFTNDLLYDTVLGILKIDTSHSQPEYSLTSDKYSIRKEELRILDGKIAITE